MTGRILIALVSCAGVADADSPLRFAKDGAGIEYGASDDRFHRSGQSGRDPPIVDDAGDSVGRPVPGRLIPAVL